MKIMSRSLVTAFVLLCFRLLQTVEAVVPPTGDENAGIGTAVFLLNTARSNTAVASRALLNNTTGGTLTNIQRIDVGPNVA